MSAPLTLLSTPNLFYEVSLLDRCAESISPLKNVSSMHRDVQLSSARFSSALRMPVVHHDTSKSASHAGESKSASDRAAAEHLLLLPHQSLQQKPAVIPPLTEEGGGGGGQRGGLELLTVLRHPPPGNTRDSLSTQCQSRGVSHGGQRPGMLTSR